MGRQWGVRRREALQKQRPPLRQGEVVKILEEVNSFVVRGGGVCVDITPGTLGIVYETWGGQKRRVVFPPAFSWWNPKEEFSVVLARENMEHASAEEAQAFLEQMAKYALTV